MVQLAATNQTQKTGYGSFKKMEDIRLSDREKRNIRQNFMEVFTIAKKIQRITKNRNVSPSFATVEMLMTLLMGLEEQREEARDDMCYFLQHEIDYIHNRQFHDKIIDI